MTKPLLDLKSVRVDLDYCCIYMVVTVTHLPTGVVACAGGNHHNKPELRDEAIVKIVENEVYQQWLAGKGE